MLVMTRRQDEGVVLFDADGCRIGRIVILSSNRVRLGLEFGRGTVVKRDELLGRSGQLHDGLRNLPAGAH